MSWSTCYGRNMAPSQHLHAVICGHVQMVGFRYFVVEKARELGLRGWVRQR